MGRKILLITTDQQRYDALGCKAAGSGRERVITEWDSQYQWRNLWSDAAYR